jgi:hypothetical protein
MTHLRPLVAFASEEAQYHKALRGPHYYYYYYTRRRRRNDLLSTGFAIIRTHKLRICEKRTEFYGMIHSIYIQFVKEL